MSKEFLGVGWKFPVRVNAKGGISYSRREQDIEESIWLILGTAKGERLMRPDFGCGIHNLVFAPVNPTTIGDIEHHVMEALSKWESRIEVQQIKVEQDTAEPNKLLIRVDYRVLSTNSYANMVYPFYLSERGGK